MLGYEGNKIKVFSLPLFFLALSYILQVQGTGSGGVADVLSHLKDNEAQYAYLRVEVPTEETTRTKFVLISWVGESTSPLKKGKVSVDKYGSPLSPPPSLLSPSSPPPLPASLALSSPFFYCFIFSSFLPPPVSSLNMASQYTSGQD